MRRPRAPELHGTWLTAEPVVVADQAPRLTVVVFGAPGDAASAAAVDHLAQLTSDADDDVVGVVALSPRHADEQDEHLARRWVAFQDHDLAVVHDPVLASWERYHPPAWPTTVVVDRRGRIAGMVDGHQPAVAAQLLADVRAEKTPAAAVGRPRPDTVLRPDPGHGSPWWPRGVGVAGDRLVVADTGFDRVRYLRVVDDDGDPAGPFDVWVESEVTGLDRPGALTILPDGGDAVVVVTEPALGRVVALGPNGPDTVLDGLTRPTALAVDGDGRLAVADGVDDRIWIVAGMGEPQAIEAADRGEDPLRGPTGLAPADDGWLVAEGPSSRLRFLAERGRLRSVSGDDHTGLLDGRPWSAAWLRPTGLCAIDGGHAVADTGNDRIRLLGRHRVETLPVAGLCRPEAVAAFADGRLLVADSGHDRLVVLDPARHTVQVVRILDDER